MRVERAGPRLLLMHGDGLIAEGQKTIVELAIPECPRVLIGEQPPHQIRRHLNLGGRHPVHRHNDQSCHRGAIPGSEPT
jgi:hypothetical protein